MNKKYKDLSKQKFARLQPIKKIGSNNGAIWLCLCDCGKQVTVKTNQLTSAKTRSCGCLNLENLRKKLIDLTNKKIGRLKVLKRTQNNKHGQVQWLCKCECGEEKIIGSSTLLSGSTKSCGCLNKELSALRNSKKIGKLNPNYNINLTDEDRRKRINSTEDLKKWRYEVYFRDNFICQFCDDNKGGNLVAHHLDGWNWCKEKRTDVDNGITLCEKCHNEFHNKYEYGNNTRYQFLEFIKVKKTKKENWIEEILK